MKKGKTGDTNAAEPILIQVDSAAAFMFLG